MKQFMLWFICFLGLVGCVPAGTNPPLPTLANVAQIPPTEYRVAIALPATFTPEPSPAASPTPTLTVSPTATATPAPTATSTPNLFPDFMFALPGREAPFLEQPPTSGDCAAGTVFRSQFPSTIGGPNRYYHAYLPPCYGRDGRVYPVLYLIHGSIQTDSHWYDLGLAYYLDEGILAGRYPPFIVIMPYSGTLGNNTSGGERSIEGVTINELLPFVDNTFCTWNEPQGRAIGGISRGGYWAFEIAFRHTDLFSGVGGHSSQFVLSVDSPTYNPLATYVAADLSQMRIWLDWGERDFLRAGQQELHNLLTAAGIPHEVRLNGGGHNEAYWQVNMRQYMDWYAAGWQTDRELYPFCP